MFFDQSWMGYGFVGALEAGAIALIIGLIAFILLHLFGRSQGWSAALEISWATLVAVILSSGSDLWNLVYFNYGRVQSLQLLKIRLAEVHDPDNLGARVLFEFVGVCIGVYLGYVIFGRRRQSS
jgi:phosphoglycerol transferase MdoB-like AlkP superfamily enzyme